MLFRLQTEAFCLMLMLKMCPFSAREVLAPEPNREPLKHLLIGTARTVTSTIHYLQVIGYADVGDWSPLMPSPNPGEVMSILSRSILVQ